MFVYNLRCESMINPMGISHLESESRKKRGVSESVSCDRGKRIARSGE